MWHSSESELNKGCFSGDGNMVKQEQYTIFCLAFPTTMCDRREEDSHRGIPFI